MATKLDKNVHRLTTIEVDSRPLIVTLSPDQGGTIQFKPQGLGKAKTTSLSISDAYAASLIDLPVIRPETPERAETPSGGISVRCPHTFEHLRKMALNGWYWDGSAFVGDHSETQALRKKIQRQNRESADWLEAQPDGDAALSAVWGEPCR